MTTLSYAEQQQGCDLCTCVYHRGKGRNVPAEDEQSSRIFSGELVAVVFVEMGFRRMRERETRVRNQHAHQRAMCARRRDRVPLSVYIDNSSHISSSASSERVPIQIACPCMMMRRSRAGNAVALDRNVSTILRALRSHIGEDNGER